MSENLEHHGVKGMKWGVRKRSRRKYPVGPIRENIPVAKTALKTNRPVGPGTGHRNYDIKKLSNKELKKVVDRMALEKRYNEINAYPQDKSKFNMESFVRENGRKGLDQAVQGAMKVATEALVKKKMENLLNPQKKNEKK